MHVTPGPDVVDGLLRRHRSLRDGGDRRASSISSSSALGATPRVSGDRATLAWLRYLASQGVRIGGVSGGPVILAKAGIMDGYHMTVHWEHAPAVAEAYPNIMLTRSIYIADRNRLTCAGGTAPLDMMHALIAEAHGPELARARLRLVHAHRHPPRPERAAGLPDGALRRA